MESSSFKAIYANDEAIQILVYPENPQKIESLDRFLAEKVQDVFQKIRTGTESGFVAEVTSGKRRYLCRAFSISPKMKHAERSPNLALLIERPSPAWIDGALIAERYRLSEREREVVENLMQGFTSREIATRMKISPNTVKAFLRLVMVKMGVTTRSGIVGRIFEARH